MLISVEYIVGFHPTQEDRLHQKFLEDNDMSEWRKVEGSTTLIAYSRKEVYGAEMNKDIE